MKIDFKNKFEYIVFAGILIVGFLFCSIIFISKSKFKIVYKQPVHNENLQCCFDYITESGSEFKCSGWIYKKNESIKQYKIDVCLYNPQKDIGFLIPCQMNFRNELTEFLNDGTDYSRCGFVSDFKVNKFINRKFKSGIYKVYIHYGCNEQNLYFDIMKEFKFE